MVAYWVARAKVNNPDQYKKYTDLVPGILEKFGGKILARGGKFKTLEGPVNCCISAPALFDRDRSGWTAGADKLGCASSTSYQRGLI